MNVTDFYQKLLGLKHPWQVVKVELNEETNRVDVWAEHRKGYAFGCPQCRRVSPLYDHSPEQSWRHLDSCQCETHLHARLARITCSEHGVCQVPATWVDGRSTFTLEFEQKMIDTLKECDVQGACRLLKSKWDQTWAVVERAVARGQARKERRIPKYMGVDEKAFAKRSRYETLVCNLKAKGATVEYVVDDRRRESLESYFAIFSQEELAGVEAVAMDMWEPYILATKAKVPGAEEKIVFDRFHVFRYVTKAVDQVRRDENKALLARGARDLVGTRYLWLRNAEKLTLRQRDEFNAIWSSGLRTGRAWVLKEVLRGFWGQPSASKAKAYFKRWYYRATHSRLEPMIQAAKTMKRHLANILTYFTHRITNATAEGLNSKIQMIKEMACGFRNREHYKTAIYFHCGGLDLYPRAPAGV